MLISKTFSCKGQCCEYLAMVTELNSKLGSNDRGWAWIGRSPGPSPVSRSTTDKQSGKKWYHKQQQPGVHNMRTMGQRTCYSWRRSPLLLPQAAVGRFGYFQARLPAGQIRGARGVSRSGCSGNGSTERRYPPVQYGV